MIDFRHKLDSKEDIETEAVVGLFRSEWKKQRASAIFCDDEVPETIGGISERLPRIYGVRGPENLAGLRSISLCTA
jgi:hypothetical protein